MNVMVCGKITKTDNIFYKFYRGGHWADHLGYVGTAVLKFLTLNMCQVSAHSSLVKWISHI